MDFTQKSVKRYMPTSLISDAQKTTIKAIIDDIHETFARTITVFEEGERVIIAASPSTLATYNGIYGKRAGGESSVTRNVVSHSIKARIKYIDAKDEILFDCNEMAKGQDYFRLVGINISPDNTKAIFGIDTVSRRQYVLKVKDLVTGEIFDTSIVNSTGGSAWAKDNNHFFYTLKSSNPSSPVIEEFADLKSIGFGFSFLLSAFICDCCVALVLTIATIED